MRITVVMPLADARGGAERLLMHALRHAPAPRASWLVIFLEDGPMARETAAMGIATAVLPSGRLREAPRALQTVARIARLACWHRSDLIFGWMPKAQLYAGPAAALARIPCLWYQHGIPTAGSWADRIPGMLPSRGILACSRFSAAAQQRAFPRRPVQVVYPAVDLAEFDPARLPSPEESRRRLGLPADGPLVGVVGRLQRWKGIHVLIEALPLVRRAHPGSRCLVVGGEHALEPDYLPFLRQRIRALGLEKEVILAGAQSNVPEWMQTMDVVVHASDVEPFGMVVIEAMALGKPVVAGREGGPGEIIRDGVDGLLAPRGDASALADAIGRYLDEPDFARRVGDAARERARSFSAYSYPERFLRAVESLLQHPVGASSEYRSDETGRPTALQS